MAGKIPYKAIKSEIIDKHLKRPYSQPQKKDISWETPEEKSAAYSPFSQMELSALTPRLKISLFILFRALVNQ